MFLKAFPILMYHSITSMPKGTKMRSLHVHPKRFSLQMKLLKLLGYRGVSITELNPYLTGNKIGKVVGISFDDGYKNNIVNALPILIKLGFTATIFIVSKNIGGLNHWDTKKGMSEHQMMNEAEINHWIKSGMEIGSHSQNHIDLVKCSNKDAYNEIKHSKIELENKFNVPVDNFCYPYGSFNSDISSITKEAGYKTAVSTIRGLSKINSNPYTLRRVSVTHHTMPHLFLLKILSSYEDNRNK
jgi:peptidoglycan/xylan/chitin deacetylase (PgdA/CDA1 family)